MAGGWAALLLAGSWRVIDARSDRRTACPFAAIALAIDLDDRAVIHKPIHRCHGHGAGGEDLLPLAERLVAGHQQRLALVAVHHQLKEHRGLGFVLADVANVVDHQQGKAIQLVERLGQGVVRLGALQLLHQRRGREKPCGAIQADQAAADARCQVGFAHATGSKQQQVLGPVDPAGVVRELLDL